MTRGDWVLHPDVHAPTARLDVRLTLLADTPRALRSDAPVHFHLGAAHVMARVAALTVDRIEPGSTALARLTLDRPIGALANDRFVLRDATATRTIGGGSVIDPFPPRRGRRRPERLSQLEALDHADPADALRALLALPPGWTERLPFLRARNLPVAAHSAMPAVAMADLLIEPAVLEELRNDVVRLLAEHHASAPDQPGLQFERLRMAMPGRPSAAAFRAIVDSLLRRGVISQDGPWLRLPTHRVTLSVRDERLWQQARELIAADRFRPPARAIWRGRYRCLRPPSALC